MSKDELQKYDNAVFMKYDWASARYLVERGTIPARPAIDLKSVETAAVPARRARCRRPRPGSRRDGRRTRM